MLPTGPFRHEHEQLLEHVGRAAREMPRLSEGEHDDLRKRIIGFLRDTLPHAEAEEKVLYPEWAKLVGFPDAAVPMLHDHEAIAARVERLETTRPSDVDALQELLYGLYALISVHFRKEEDPAVRLRCRTGDRGQRARVPGRGRRTRILKREPRSGRTTVSTAARHRGDPVLVEAEHVSPRGEPGLAELLRGRRDATTGRQPSSNAR